MSDKTKLDKWVYDITDLSIDGTSDETRYYMIEPKKSYGSSFFARMGTSTDSHRLANFDKIKTWIENNFGPGTEITRMFNLLEKDFADNWAWSKQEKQYRIYISGKIKFWLDLNVW